MLISKEIFRAYDIRGNSLTDITEAAAYKIGYCFAQIVTKDSNKICVGRDGRLSSPALYNSLVKGLIDGGALIISIGIVPSPMLYFADKQLLPAASIMVTGSHNPKDDNGFKMLKQGKPFFGSQIQNLLTKILATDWSNILGINLSLDNMIEMDFTEQYLDRILNNIYINPKLKIAWDPGNGSAGNIIEALKAKLPNHNIIINSEIDGNFPSHHPDPTKPSNLKELITIVEQENCDIGIAFDGDGDRLGIVGKNGQILFGDQIICLFAKDILKEHPKATVILDVKASQLIINQIKSYGGQALMCRTGHPFIKSKMLETGALLAGEMSGHIFFADKYYGYDDAIYAALRFLDLLSRSNKSLEQLAQKLPKSFNTPEIKIFVPEAIKFKIINEIKEQLLKEEIEFNDIDGVRVNTEHGWWLLRSSNTEPAIIARAESITAEGLEEIKLILGRLLSKYNLLLRE